MRIERPDWKRMGSPFLAKSTLDRWFDDVVEPINKMLSEGVEVVGDYTDSGYWVYDTDKPTHKALLINIELTKKDTAEDLIRDLLSSDVVMEADGLENWKRWKQRAKEVLGE